MLKRKNVNNDVGKEIVLNGVETRRGGKVKGLV